MLLNNLGWLLLWAIWFTVPVLDEPMQVMLTKVPHLLTGLSLLWILSVMVLPILTTVLVQLP